ncbi:MAG: CHAD domain-containing protein [Actinophytocola sp.]|uniref:CHAD domain-containing protein n=1 Tax=Actinophytocola sp. TaxID=1872138 RepID=UPI0013205A56|nr:CHAD domain-containing protein [Actinophytocola sp.]MPZ79494.1 CHAD domain-containing protein [Actinophytocola sp.]
MTRSAPASPVELGLPATPRKAAADDPPAQHVRARLDEQVRALLEHEEVAREGEDPEGVHQMRVAVRRIRAALKASDEPDVELLQAELRWFGGILGRIRDLDVLLGHLRAQAADLPEDEQAAVERLLRGLDDERRRARRRMLDTLRGARYETLLRTLATAATSDAPVNGYPVAERSTAPALLDVIVKPHRKLAKAARALGEDPPDDELHALRIRGKRLRYAAELAEPAAGKPVRRLIKATKDFQDVLGDHQDTVVAEEEVRRLLAERTDADQEVVFVAGRLVERERARRADCRARWRDAFEEVDRQAAALVR